MKKITGTFFFLFMAATSLCQPWTDHGRLRVSENGHYLEHENGTGFFWLGCTAWMLPRLSPEDVDRYLDDRAAKKFNVIQFTLNNMGRPNYAGELPVLGDKRPWDEVNINESYWQHIDYIVQKAREKNLYLAMFVWWGSDADDPGWESKKNTRQHFTNPDVHNREFGHFLGNRYNDQPNIIWVGAGECHKPVAKMFPNNQSALTIEHKKRVEAVIHGIRESDKENVHLYTIHPISFLSSSEDFHSEDWLDFNMVQSHAIPETIVPLTKSDWELVLVKPTLNSEGWYEGETELFSRWTGMQKTDGSMIDPAWNQRLQAYWSVFSGSIGFTYGHKLLWRMEDQQGNPGILKEEILNAPGAQDLIHLKNLIESKPIQDRIPDSDLVTSGSTGRSGGLSPDLRICTRDINGTWAFIYSTRGSLIRLRLNRLQKGPIDAYWYNPRNGKWRVGDQDSEHKKPFETEITIDTKTESRDFKPPGKPADGNDWVLVLEVNTI